MAVIGDGQVTIEVRNTGGLQVDGFYQRANTRETPTQSGTRTGDGPLTLTSMRNRTAYHVYTQLKNAAGYGPASNPLLLTPRAAGDSDLDSILIEIRSQMQQVTGIGQVHFYQRHSAHWEQYIQHAVSKGRVNAWYLSRVARPQALAAVDNLGGSEPFFHDTHNIRVHGYMALKDVDNTEKEFQALIDGIALRIQLNTTLNGAVLLPKMIQAPSIDSKSFGGVLCHFTEMTFEAIVRTGG